MASSVFLSWAAFAAFSKASRAALGGFCAAALIPVCAGKPGRIRKANVHTSIRRMHLPLLAPGTFMSVIPLRSRGWHDCRPRGAAAVVEGIHSEMVVEIGAQAVDSGLPLPANLVVPTGLVERDSVSHDVIKMWRGYGRLASAPTATQSCDNNRDFHFILPGPV